MYDAMTSPDREPKPHVPQGWGAFPCETERKSAQPHEEDAEGDRERCPTTAPAGTPSFNAIALKTSTTTGADPRAIGYTTDTSPPSYARASSTK